MKTKVIAMLIALWWATGATVSEAVVVTTEGNAGQSLINWIRTSPLTLSPNVPTDTTTPLDGATYTPMPAGIGWQEMSYTLAIEPLPIGPGIPGFDPDRNPAIPEPKWTAGIVGLVLLGFAAWRFRKTYGSRWPTWTTP